MIISGLDVVDEILIGHVSFFDGLVVVVCSFHLNIIVLLEL